MSKENRLPAKTRVVGGTGQGLQRVYISKEVYKDIFNFSKDKNVVQAGGILLGNKLRKGETHYYIIRAFIEAKHCEATSNSIKFTKDTIKYIEQVKKNYPSYKIIGWMHTNPDTGCNATEYDEYFQTRTFEGKNIIEYIVDPVQIVEAFYYMENGKMKKIDGFFIFTDDESKKKEKRIIPEIAEPVQKLPEAEVAAEESDNVESPDAAVVEEAVENPESETVAEEATDDNAEVEEATDDNAEVEEEPVGETEVEEPAEEVTTESVDEQEEEVVTETSEEPAEEVTTESVDEQEEEVAAETSEEPAKEVTTEPEEEPVEISTADVSAKEEYPEVEIPMVEAYDVDAHSNVSEDYQDESDSEEIEEYESDYDSDDQSQDYIDEIAQAFEENYNLEMLNETSDETSNEDFNEKSNEEAREESREESSEEPVESDINEEMTPIIDEKSEEKAVTPFLIDDTVASSSVAGNEAAESNLREEITLEEVKNNSANEFAKVFEESETKIEDSDSVNYIYPEEEEEYHESTKGLKRFVGILTALLVLSLGVVVVLFWKVNSLNNYINSMQGYVNGLHSEIDKLHTDVESLNGVAETLYENDVNLTNIINGETTAAETTAEETKAQETAADENSEDNKKEEDKNDNKDDNNDDNKEDNN